MNPPIRVTLTEASGRIAYSLIYLLGQENLFGPYQPIILQLFDFKEPLDAFVAEIQNASFPLILDVTGSNQPEETLNDADVVIILGDHNIKMISSILAEVSSPGVYIIIMGSNSTAEICYQQTFSPNITLVSCYDQNRATAELASYLKVGVGKVKDVVIWGSEGNIYPDVRFATVDGNKVSEMIQNDFFLRGAFVETIQKLNVESKGSRKISMAMGKAKSIADHLRSLWLGSTEKWISMGVQSDGSYGVPKGLFFSFPVVIKDRKWEIFQGLEIDDFSQAKLDLALKQHVK